INAWNSHDVDQALKFYSPDYSGEDVGRAQRHQGHAGAREFIGAYVRAFPDVLLSADEMIGEGERAALMWTARGTHRGAIMNILPTNRPVQIRGVSLLTLKQDKIYQATYIWDVAGLLRNIGLLPELNSEK
ncbi:MAG TPA: ester cyclase, partial [Anaerolineae bacterium]